MTSDTDEVRGALRAVGRRLPEILVGLAAVLTLLAGLALVGAAVDDRGIAAHRVVTTAEVLDGSSFARTLIRFERPDGEEVVPERGVFYPRGTTPGQSVGVEYDATNPELVRVSGHSAVDGLVPTGLGVLVGWVVLGSPALWLRRRRVSPAA